MSGQPVDGAHHLEGELRHAVAEVGERQALEHDIGEAAIGGRERGAFLRDDERIGGLRLASPRCTRMAIVARSISRPSAQTRRTKAIGPSHRPMARLAK